MKEGKEEVEEGSRARRVGIPTSRKQGQKRLPEKKKIMCRSKIEPRREKGIPIWNGTGRPGKIGKFVWNSRRKKHGGEGFVKGFFFF